MILVLLITIRTLTEKENEIGEKEREGKEIIANLQKAALAREQEIEEFREDVKR